MEGSKEQPKKEYSAEEFYKAYQALCEKYGYQIIVNPAFKARDDGTFSVVLQAAVGKLPEKDK